MNFLREKKFIEKFLKISLHFINILLMIFLIFLQPWLDCNSVKQAAIIVSYTENCSWCCCSTRQPSNSRITRVATLA